MPSNYEQIAHEHRQGYGFFDHHLEGFEDFYLDDTHFIYEQIQNTLPSVIGIEGSSWGRCAQPTCLRAGYNADMLFTTAETDTDWDELSESEEIDRKAALAKFVPNFAGVIGDRVSIRRRELKLSQKNLATIYGVSRELISQIETGRANINACDLPRLALILVVPISYFFGGIEYTSDSYDKDVLASISPGARDAIKFALDESGRSGQALRPDEDELLSYYRGLGLGVKSVVLNMAKNLFELGQIRSKVDSDDDNEAEM